MQSPLIIEFGDMAFRFPLDPETSRVGLELFPASLKDQLASRRQSLRGEPFIDVLPGDAPWPARSLESLAQLKILGDPFTGGFASGHTMRNSPSTDGFRFANQQAIDSGDSSSMVTVLENGKGHRLEHRILWRKGGTAVEMRSEFFNDSKAPVTLEMLASFSLGGITPFATDDATGRLRVHRFRSGWAAEGRLESRSIEELHLERSWSGAGAFSERFGQVGTMPVRKWFPFLAVEDTLAGVVWGAQLAWAGSWQMEVFRQHDELSISGGIADREFGHWKKTLQPGESLRTPSVIVSCVHGTLAELCDRLTSHQQHAAASQPEVETELPIIFNEFCTTWGDPRHERLIAIADRLRGSAVRYLVIDAGWYRPNSASWDGAHGDWTPSPDLFPNGLKATADAIRQRGFIPGLWFEMESVGENSAAYSLTEHLLKRDGVPVTIRGRRFWDFTDPWVIEYLEEKMVGLLERCGFGYLKVDYNESLGLGCDHSDSLGEGLRQQVIASQRFFETLRERLPHLVIENCSSGGHRLEPSMLARTSMSSFSDAHELPEIPLIAANLHSLMLPRQSQIWAVLHASDTEQRLAYSLAATFLGRMCLSGDIAGLSPSQWQFVQNTMALYQKAAPIIKSGVSRRFGSIGASWRHPSGWQALRRIAADGKTILVVAHGFANAPRTISIPLPEKGSWQIVGQLPAAMAQVRNSRLEIELESDFAASVHLLGLLP